MTKQVSAPLRVAICWPAPRAARVAASSADPALYEAADGLSFLNEHGIEWKVVDSSPPRLNPGHGRGSLVSGIDPWRSLRLLWRYRQYDVLVSIDSSSAFLFVLAKRLLRLRKPVVVIDPALDPGWRNRMRMQWAVLPHAAAVVVYGRVQRHYLTVQRPGIRAHFVPHRIDCRFFDPELATPPTPVSGKGDYILAVGSDIGRDYPLLIQAARQLGLPLVLHTRRDLPLDLPANVQVQRDWISFEALRDLYAGAAVVVVPLKDTLHASGVNGLLEALAMGRPTVVSASRGIADYVDDGANACVVPVGDATALVHAIGALWEDRALAERLGQAARARALADSAMPIYAARIAQLLRASLTI
jgi:glycosyltransferase involved in cell wall biosynthesis